MIGNFNGSLRSFLNTWVDFRRARSLTANVSVGIGKDMRDLDPSKILAKHAKEEINQTLNGGKWDRI